MAHKATRLKSRWEVLGFEVLDLSILFATFIGSMTTLPSIVGARLGFALTFLIAGGVFGLWVGYKKLMPPKFLGDFARYMTEADVYTVTPDIKSVPLIINLEVTKHMIRRKRKKGGGSGAHQNRKVAHARASVPGPR